MMDLSSRQAMLETVRGLRRDLDQVILQVSEERAVEPSAFGPWSFKDLIAHLTGWRLVTAARLEAGWHDREPDFPWPDHFDEAEDLDAINHWFYEINRDKPLEQVLQESNDTFDRVERALQEAPEDVLLQPGRFAWVFWTDGALGPAVVRGTYTHFHEDHEPDIHAWLSKA